MTHRHSRELTRAALGALGAALLLPLGGCLDGPFARVNPHDAAADITLSIVGGVDTARVVGETVFYRLLTDPVTSGVTVVWRTDTPARLLPVGEGRFVVLSLPLAPATAEITAIIGGNSATRTLVLMPATP